ncbi:pullulanase [Clostridium acetobutylicum]|uniref:Pullulanase n=1 Tax=Clostridium acetobutylicum (strain ATCC 824 / DSM 792 / JCM 1419 / IAM 19013 / LMG 5710 / NBRC 13948 / NRRL B-527 / VKM B-1787 / 2291 / W) TaxID=272562 RepID=Q97FP9_CLOAB|nr:MULTISPECIES: type I pullulanase [Clostridium]AAK80626.1 Pullulanase [Clostridium acetobutylicum ATCC 824]ADZ21725.1 Pullulanase [Clostridium acetobutylicum EA 2018]AEI32497.1 pullulanase [Clostridium acetobutylicum DSM 1731]AWV78957.1 type I pullulanase [Clostridium acetobutylicum]MBC2395197.1 type I pullulanase [Clostridium acetobutylicum]
MVISNAFVTQFNKIEFQIDDFTNFLLSKITVRNTDGEIKINEYRLYKNNVCLLIDNIDIKKNYYVSYDKVTLKCSYYKLFSTTEFNNKYAYNGKLGITYTREKTTFRIWSPGASSIELLLYNHDITSNEPATSIKMKEDNGLWFLILKGDFKNFYYNYKVTIYNYTKEVVDPYAKAVGINGLRGAILDSYSTNPPNWKKDFVPQSIEHFTDAIIYEISINDISLNPNSGILHKGKYLGLCEENSKTINNIPTGIKYLKSLGITHVQIMPIFDFSYKSIDETNPINYNWGYDPQNYNVPEGAYSTDPYNPRSRIYELKTLIKTLHENGICVNMDVVFNHLWNEKENNFEKIFPEYYLRRNDDNSFSNGTGCGNDTASEHYMFQKFILDSIKYWVKEYHIDGFRFDLMGIHDIETMNKLRDELNKINSNIMLYGEGWDLTTNIEKTRKAIILNSSKTPEIGYFNDVIRDALKGSVFIPKDTGFISGKFNLEKTILYTTLGCCLDVKDYKKIFSSPSQSINYVSCHDNNTLYDKLCTSNPHDNDDIRKEKIKLAIGILLTSQGIPFLHCGVEFARTKFGITNSYNSAKEINWIDWDLRDKNKDLVNYVISLIAFRKNHSAFRFVYPNDLKNHLEITQNMPKNSIGYILKNHANNDAFKDIMVIYNANTHDIQIPLDSTWNVCIDKYNAGSEKIRTASKFYIAEALSINVLFKNSENSFLHLLL